MKIAASQRQVSVVQLTIMPEALIRLFFVYSRHCPELTNEYQATFADIPETKKPHRSEASIYMKVESGLQLVTINDIR